MLKLDPFAVSIDSPSYPDVLREIDDAPAVLYCYGNPAGLITFNHDAAVAVLGARRATAYGREVAYTLGTDLAELGLTVVSDLALGVGGAAHRGALVATGRTIAVVAGDPSIPYPRNHRLLHEQIADRSCILSEHGPGHEPTPADFASRFRIITALAKSTVLVEAMQGSGTLHAATFALAQRRDLAAVPGPITSRMSSSPNDLIRRNIARAVCSAHDVIHQAADPA